MLVLSENDQENWFCEQLVVKPNFAQESVLKNVTSKYYILRYLKLCFTVRFLILCGVYKQFIEQRVFLP